jgi:ABC-2 type transport system permease protein
MNKYLVVLKISFLEYLSYRLNFILWRFRSLLSILITYYLWQAVFFNSEMILGYKRSEMLTYIVLINFITSISQSSQTFKIASEINTGALSALLIKPVNYFGFNISRDLSDKLINIISSTIEIVLLFFFLKVPFVFQGNFQILVYFLLAIIMSSVLFFEINVILSFVGFWSLDAWAPRFIFYILIAFLSGTFFPLDILSTNIYQLLNLLPFPYLVFFPLKIYLGNFNNDFLYRGLFISSVWSFILAFLMKFIWNKGLKIYRAEGG